MQASLHTDWFDQDTSPAALERIETLSGDLDSQPKDWVAALASTPPVCADLLQVVNAAYGRLSGPVASVQQAIALLGFNTIKNLAARLARSAAARTARA